MHRQEYSFAAHMMGSDLTVTLICDDSTVAEQLFATLLAHCVTYEERFSRFLTTSELSALNSVGEMIVSEKFLHILSRAIELSDVTSGAYNPLVQVRQIGYDRNFADIPQHKASTPPQHYSTALKDISIDRVTRKVCLTSSQQLDFGGFLKGFVAQEMAEIAAEDSTVSGVIINLSGDLCTRGTDVHGNDFIFTLHNPLTPHEPITLVLNDKSLSTSGTYKRIWNVGDAKSHHIISPLTCENPLEDVVSASVISTNGALSDALATSAIVLKSQKALLLLRDLAEGYCLIHSDGTIHSNDV